MAQIQGKYVVLSRIFDSSGRELLYGTLEKDGDLVPTKRNEAEVFDSAEYCNNLIKNKINRIKKYRKENKVNKATQEIFIVRVGSKWLPKKSIIDLSPITIYSNEKNSKEVYTKRRKIKLNINLLKKILKNSKGNKGANNDY